MSARRRLGLQPATILAAALGIVACAPAPRDPDGPLDVPLVTQDHRRIHLRDQIRGQVVLLSFTYTRCNGSCPLTTHNLVQVQKALGDHLGRDVFLYSISLDPEVDTPDVLADYAKTLGAKPGWTFLTGKLEDITRLRRSLGLYDLDPSVDADRTRHSGLIVYGNEATGAWSAIAGLAPPPRIVDSLLRVMRPGAGGACRKDMLLDTCLP